MVRTACVSVDHLHTASPPCWQGQPGQPYEVGAQVRTLGLANMAICSVSDNTVSMWQVAARETRARKLFVSLSTATTTQRDLRESGRGIRRNSSVHMPAFSKRAGFFVESHVSCTSSMRYGWQMFVLPVVYAGLLVGLPVVLVPVACRIAVGRAVQSRPPQATCVARTAPQWSSVSTTDWPVA